MDVEEVSNLTSITNFTSTQVTLPRDTYWDTFLSAFAIVAVCSITANVLTIFVIYKYSRLSKQVTNMILLHFNLVQMIFLLSAPLILRVLYELSRRTAFNYAVFCVANEFNGILTLGALLLLILLVCDWYIKTYNDNVYKRFCNIYGYFVTGIYILCILSIGILSQLCYRNIYSYSDVFRVLLAIAVAASVLVINIVHKIKSKRLAISERRYKNNVGLAIANIFFLAWSPNLLLIILGVAQLVRDSIVAGIILSLGFLSPVWNFIYLYKFDDDFNVFYKRILKCQCSNHYENQELTNDVISYTDPTRVDNNRES